MTGIGGYDASRTMLKVQNEEVSVAEYYRRKYNIELEFVSKFSSYIDSQNLH